MVSEISCARMEATPSSALPPLGPTVCTWQVLGQRSVLPTKPYLHNSCAVFTLLHTPGTTYLHKLCTESP